MSQAVQMRKNLPAIQETWDQSLDQGRSPGEGNGNTLQYSCLENSVDRGALWAIVHGVTQVFESLCTSLQTMVEQ